MAIKYPLILNGVRFYVNPTSLKIKNSLAISSLATHSGVKYVVWYDSPAQLTISGFSAEDTAYKELLFLKENFENTDKISTLFYKTTVYTGIITSLNVDYSYDNPNKFPYSIEFQLLFGQKFKIEDFALQATGIIGGLMGDLTTALSTVDSNVNIAIADSEKWVKDRLGIK
jgi:hypothetical protein